MAAAATRMTWLGLLVALLGSPAAWCQDNPYIYVRMPLTVPWTLYFIFLGAVLIPFVVMIVLAWRKPPANRPGRVSPPRQDPAGRDA